MAMIGYSFRGSLRAGYIVAGIFFFSRYGGVFLGAASGENEKSERRMPSRYRCGLKIVTNAPNKEGEEKEGKKRKGKI